ncbi:MAG: ATP-dependent metalloprotease, partial [Gammaproteobacteria bacterium]|nr:ATP-dependent metalloprotease [Gammaproteobacteria bacterium]
DRYSYSKRRLESSICSLFGGRIAEELIFGKDAVTTGASNDIERATQIARNMVVKWGLSEKMGPLSYEEDEGEVFLGHSMASKGSSVSGFTQRDIDEEIRAIIDKNYQRAEQILKEKSDKLNLMAEALMKYETIDTHQIRDIMDGKEPRPPEGWSDSGQPPSGGASADSGEQSGDKGRDDSVGDPASQH